MKKENLKNYYVTRNGYKKIYEDYLNVDKEISDTIKLIGESVKRDYDLRENPEFMGLRVKAMYELPAKKQNLWDKYNSAIIIEDTNPYRNFDGKTVIRGSVVEINIDNEEQIKYQIKGSDEGDISNNILSCDAPIAIALLDHKIGETIEFNDMKIKILGVEKI